MRCREKIFLLLFCFSITLHAQQKKVSLINYGIKAGFSSTIYDIQELKIAGNPINEYNAKSEISLLYTAFTRINLSKHYIQTEISYNISNYTIFFPTQSWYLQANSNDLSTISTRIIGFEVPLYYGYHFLKEGPYSMSFFLGPKFKFIATKFCKYQFDNFDYNSITESIYPVNASIMTGIGINIGRIFFDFSFEYGLHNISKCITTTDDQEQISTNEFIFNRRKNMLSFSLGFMF